MTSRSAFAAIFMASVLPVLALAGTTPGSGIEGTRHDFSNGSGDVCAYCHLLPWDDSGDRAYSWDVASTVAGTPITQIHGGPSARCLACHDGTIAVNRVPRVMGTAIVGANGSLAGHHPVGLPYPLLQAPNTYNGARSGRYLELEEWQSNPTLMPAANIRLFRDDGAGNAVVMQKGEATAHAGIECSSCHDPHNDQSKDAHFLRGRMAGNSASDGFICKQCHAK